MQNIILPPTLADGEQRGATEAEGLGLGLDMGGRTVLLLKKRDQILAYPLDIERARQLAVALIRAFPELGR